jgi:hypothetical protein
MKQKIKVIVYDEVDLDGAVQEKIEEFIDKVQQAKGTVYLPLNFNLNG